MKYCSVVGVYIYINILYIYSKNTPPTLFCKLLILKGLAPLGFTTESSAIH